MKSQSSHIVTVIRRDMLGHSCLTCGEGNYYENSLSNYLEGKVSCNRCGDRIHRWMSKREILVESGRRATKECA